MKGMGYAVQPSAAVAELLKKRREELGLTLRDVEAQAAALGDPIPFTVIARTERGLVDPGFRRLSLLLRIYQLPIQVAGQLADLEQIAGVTPSDPEVGYEDAYAEAIRQWKAGDLRQGLRYFLSLRTPTAGDAENRLQRQKALHAVAIAAASMSKYRLSKEIIDGLLLEPPEPSLLVQVLVHGAACWHRLGSTEVALAFLDRAERHVAPDDHQKRAWVCHNRAATLVTMGRFEEAAAEVERAVEAYRAAGDTHGECIALGVLVRLHTDRGDLRAALDAARAAQEHARTHRYERLRVMRRVDEGGILLKCGETQAGIAALADALGAATTAQDEACQFHAHYHLWKAYEALRDPARAAVELHAAQYHVRFLDETTPEAVEVRETMGGRRAADVAPDGLGAQRRGLSRGVRRPRKLPRG
jgi:tetratricopeptide (TPR) repeat protein